MVNTTAILTNSRRILSCYYYNFLELLAVKTKFFHSLLLGWRKPVFINETKLAKVTSKDAVLLIGCGIFPSETMVIAQETGAHVTGIDNAPNVVKIARKYIKKKRIIRSCHHHPRRWNRMCCPRFYRYLHRYQCFSH